MADVSGGRRLFLASGSTYRSLMLGRLGLAFQAQSPDVDESPLQDEGPGELALRLAAAKAAAITLRNAGAWIIGSDQVATCAGERLGKPGHRDHAVRQLRLASGRPIEFHTAVCLLGPNGFERDHVDLTRVRVRHLEESEIQDYVEREPALDCAGSFKAEGLGITLFDAVESQDPTAIVGLPLIALCRMLREAGFRIP